MNIGEICKRNVVTAQPQASLADVAVLMRRFHVGSVVIIESGGSGVPVGIVTDRDIVLEAVASERDLATLTAGELMTRDLVTASESDDALGSLKVMRDRAIRRLPVLDAAGRLAGMVTLDDLLESATFALSDVVEAIGNQRAQEVRMRGAPA